METEVEKFWDIIENKLGCSVPKYLQNILALRGYENAHSIKTITQEDLSELQKYVRSDEMMERVPKDADFRDYFGVFHATPKKCYVLPGHMKLLIEIVEFVKLSIISKGMDHFSTKPKQIQQGLWK